MRRQSTWAVEPEETVFTHADKKAFVCVIFKGEYKFYYEDGGGSFVTLVTFPCGLEYVSSALMMQIIITLEIQ